MFATRTWANFISHRAKRDISQLCKKVAKQLCTLFHVLRKQNISLHAFVTTNAVLVKKKGRGILTILRPFPVGRYYSI